MKTKTKSIIIIIVLLILYFIVFMLTSSETVNSAPSYTVYNTYNDGTSLIYDTLKYMGYPVEISYNKISPFTNIYDSQIIIEPNNNNFTETEMEEILDWVYEGGLLFYFNSDSELVNKYLYEYDSPYYVDDYVSIFTYGYGEVVVGDTDSIINENLKDNTLAGEVICDILSYWELENIVFNEYYHVFKKPGIWAVLPVGFKMVVYQIIIICLVLIWFLGKRFGKPVPYFEEVEREENEHIKALAVIYKNASMGEVIIKCYYNHFYNLSSKYFGLSLEQSDNTIINLWKSNNMPYLEILQNVKKIIDSSNKFNIKRKSEYKEFFKIIVDIKKLIKVVKLKY